MSQLADVLVFAGIPERIAAPEKETFVTVKLHGGGAVQRKIGSGKTPVPFTGYRVKADQFIYSRIDARNGAFAIVPTALDGAVVSKDFPIFDIRHDRVDPSYLNHFFRAGRLQQAIQAQSSGATNRQRIQEDRLLAFDIALPSLHEQRRIAAILDHADALRAKRHQVLAHIVALTRSIFHDMFPADSFASVRAREIMPQMRNGLSPATAGAYSANVLTLSAVTGGAFDPTAVKAGLFAVDPPPEKRVNHHDFLMCRGNGNKTLVGVGAFSRANRPDLVFPDTVIAGRIDTSKVTMDFLGTAWQQPGVRRQIEAGARTTNGTYKVNQQTLSNITLSLPPLSQQLAFDALVGQVNIRRATIQRAQAADDALFASLQSCAFRGTLG